MRQVCKAGIHGRIDVRSVPGSGTTFRITLPVRQAQAVVP